MKIIIGIVFMFAFAMSCVLLENFIKNLVAFLKFYESHGIKDSALYRGWMVYVTAILWAAFITLKLYLV